MKIVNEKRGEKNMNRYDAIIIIIILFVPYLWQRTKCFRNQNFSFASNGNWLFWMGIWLDSWGRLSSAEVEASTLHCLAIEVHEKQMKIDFVIVFFWKSATVDANDSAIIVFF